MAGRTATSSRGSSPSTRNSGRQQEVTNHGERTCCQSRNTAQRNVAVILPNQYQESKDLQQQQQGTRRGSEDQIHALRNALRAASTENDQLLTERGHLEQLCMHFERKCRILSLENQGAQSALQNARSENTALRKDLQECRDDLFRLQPLSEISDSEILQRYETLNQQIVSWVDDLFSELDKEITRHEATGEVPLPLVKTDNDYMEALISEHPNAAEYLVRSYIQYYLHSVVFGENSYLLCLPDDMVATLEHVEKHMHSLVPQRGKIF